VIAAGDQSCGVVTEATVDANFKAASAGSARRYSIAFAEDIVMLGRPATLVL
jgi:hypothetical protein